MGCRQKLDTVISRRKLLGLCSLPFVALAGCNRLEPEPTATPDEETPEPPEDDSVLDIRDFGAALDGQTDDTAAIQDAIDAAEPGDTVVLPSGTALVSGANKEQAGTAAIVINGNNHPDGLTIRGKGEESVLKMDGGHVSNHTVIEVAIGPGIDGLVLENFKIDGSKYDQTQAAGLGGWNVDIGKADTSTTTADITLRDLWSINANQNGFHTAHGGCSHIRCTALDAELHGFAIDSWGDGDRNMDPPIEVRQCYASGNGLYGIDCSGGKIVVEGFVSENNQQGTKTTEEVVETTYRRCRFKDNKTLGYNRPTTETVVGQRARVTFVDVIAEGNGRAGFRFGSDTDYEIDRIVARRNNSSNENPANIMIRDDSSVDGGLVISNDAVYGEGLRFDSSRTSTIDTYVYSGNPGGDLVADRTGLEILNRYTREEYYQLHSRNTLDLRQEHKLLREQFDSIDRGIPTADDVGAGSGDRTPYS
ncbi:MAG: glycosyl hydrolase family 28-related protein [Halobacteriota archaeon]